MARFGMTLHGGMNDKHHQTCAELTCGTMLPRVSEPTQQQARAIDAWPVRTDKSDGTHLVIKAYPRGGQRGMEGVWQGGLGEGLQGWPHLSSICQAVHMLCPTEELRSACQLQQIGLWVCPSCVRGMQDCTTAKKVYSSPDLAWLFAMCACST